MKRFITDMEKAQTCVLFCLSFLCFGFDHILIFSDYNVA